MDNLVVKLCIEGTRAEFEGRPDDARRVYWQAWEAVTDDYEACIAAHYVARFQENPGDALRWNLEALARADAVRDDRVESFYPSLFVNLGRSYELLGNELEATHYYGLAAELGLLHQED
jgi:hypothetical protein